MDEQLMIRYIQGECSDDEKTIIQEWLLQSEENRKLFYETKALWNYSKVMYFGSEEQLNKAVKNLNRNIQSVELLRKKKLYLRFAKYAAVLVLAMSIPVVIWTTYQHINSNSGLITIAVAQTDSSKLITLSDNTRVWLNSNSSITYPLKFSRSERNVTFSGEAYFEVKHDSLHPFIVKTSNVQVRVLGTSFDVRAYPSEKKTETTLVKGRVIIQNKRGESLAILAPGQLAVFDKTSNYLSIREVDAEQYTHWRYGLITFANASFNDITRKLEEVYQVHFIMRHSEADPATYNFSFRKSQPIDKVLDMLSFIAPLNYNIQGKEIYITSK